MIFSGRKLSNILTCNKRRKKCLCKGSLWSGLMAGEHCMEWATKWAAEELLCRAQVPAQQENHKSVKRGDPSALRPAAGFQDRAQAPKKCLKVWEPEPSLDPYVKERMTDCRNLLHLGFRI